MNTGEIVKLGALFFLIVPGCGAAGHFIAGLVALVLGKDEELWMRRGEIMFGCIGLGGWLGVTLVVILR